MIVVVIGTVLSATPTHLVEVQDTVVLVAQDFANEAILLRNEMVAYFPTTITSLPECCTPETLTDVNAFVGGYATNISENRLNWDCPIRGSPIT